MRGENDDLTACSQAPDKVHNRGCASSIKLRGWFIDQEQIVLCGEGSRQAEALGFTTRQAHERTVGQLFKADGVQKLARLLLGLGTASPSSQDGHSHVIKRAAVANSVGVLRYPANAPNSLVVDVAFGGLQLPTENGEQG